VRVARASLRVAAALILMAAAALVLAPAALGQTDPPASGDWSIADTTTISGATLALNASITVQAGGSLSVADSTLNIASAPGAPHQIRVEAGGSLNLTRTHVNASDPSAPYRFRIYGSAVIESSWIEYMWGSSAGEIFGIEVYSSTVRIANSTVEHGWRGNIFISGGSPTLYNNQIRNGLYLQTNLYTTSCFSYPKYEAVGVMVVAGAHPTFEGNTIAWNGAENFTDRWREVFDGASPQSFCNGNYSVVSYLFGRGMVVDGAGVEAVGNTFSNNSRVPFDGEPDEVINGWNVRHSHTEGDLFGTPRYPAGMSLVQAFGNLSDSSFLNNAELALYVEQSSAAVRGGIIRGNGGGYNHAGFSGAVTLDGAADLEGLWFSYNPVHMVLLTAPYGRFESLHFDQNGSSGYSLYFMSTGADRMVFSNSTWDTRFYEAVTPWTDGYATIEFRNCTVSANQMRQFNTHLTVVYSYLVDYRAQWRNGLPVAGGEAVITNATGAPLANDTLDAAGRGPSTWAPVLTMVWTGDYDATEIHNDSWSLVVGKRGVSSAPLPFVVSGNVALIVTMDDPSPPALQVLGPLPGSHISARPLRVWGQVSDAGAGLASVNITWDGGATWVETNQSPFWSVDLILPDGLYDIVVAAKDLAGSMTIVTVASILVDTRAPTITLAEPALPATTPAVAYTTATGQRIRGTTSEDADLLLGGVLITNRSGPFETVLSLVEGPNYFTLEAVDLAGNRAHLDFVLVLDTVSPALLIVAPAADLVTSRASLVINGSTEWDASVMVNGVLITTAEGAFYAPFELQEGVNRISVNATDPAGNTATKVVTVVLDRAAPTVAITAPEDGTSTRLAEVTIRGTVAADADSILVNGLLAQAAGGEFAAVVALSEGSNVIFVEAADAAGNRANASITVVRDSTPPVVVVASPRGGALLAAARVTVNGTAEGAAAVSIEGARADLSGAAFSAEVLLHEGDNTLTVTARDAAGNTATLVLVVRRDTTPPALTLSLPPSPIRTDAWTYTVRGKAEGAVAVRINGVLVGVDADGSFTAVIPLELGENRITVRATDEAGNTADAEARVIRGAQPGVTNGGILGLGDASYALLPLLFAAGVIAALLWSARRRAEGVAPPNAPRP
jgi:hypothetical protein